MKINGLRHDLAPIHELISASLGSKQTRRKLFLLDMQKVVPWYVLLSVVETFYPKSVQSACQPMLLSMML